MKHLVVTLTVAFCMIATSFSQVKLNAFMKHRDLGSLKGAIRNCEPCFYDPSNLFFYEDSTGRKISVNPDVVDLIKVDGLGVFRSFPLKINGPGNFVLDERRFVRTVFKGMPFSLLESEIEGYRYFLYEDRTKGKVGIWRWSQIEEQQYEQAGDYLNQLQQFAAREQVIIPLEFLQNGRYEVGQLIWVTKLLNRDSSWIKPLDTSDYDRCPTRWSVSVRGTFGRQQYFSPIKQSGPTIEFGIARDFQDEAEESIVSLGAAFGYSVSSGRGNLGGKNIQLAFEEFFIKPSIMGALDVGEPIVGMPLYLGLRYGYYFSYYNQAFTIDGQLGEEGLKRDQKRSSIEVDLQLKLKRNLAAEIAFALNTNREDLPSVNLFVGAYFRWH
ncbi:hypothetical protein [Chitinophaga barathri]|uniref:Uncharacterized protein n=1 Tax=Chitinophaga barathri TaxID=1647451 RepID=A0A3N4MM29_9BACT|nr:hypothetical protein [Chitinophaga barathri]RPD43126.1 hypothetical protein EG028_02190 [Chitinophaga barathri]